MNPTNNELADAIRDIANGQPLGAALILRLAADRLPLDTEAPDLVKTFVGIGGGWVEWDPSNGESCPVKPGTRTAVRFRDGGEHTDDTPQCWSWDEVGGSSIVAYRVVPN